MEVFEDMEEFVEEDLVNLVEIVNPDRQYIVRPRINHFNTWDDHEFVQRFRLSKHSVQRLLERIEHRLQYTTERNHALSPLEQLLIALRFYASGNFYIAIGDCAGVHKSTAGKVIKRVTDVLVDLRRDFIHFPATEEAKQQKVVQFGEIARFPRVLGAIDCTHIKLLSPGGHDAEYYRNRKGYFSLNVQAICDANNCFQDIVVRWPGATHDSYIFNNSAAKMRFEAGHMDNLLLLGDGGYPVKSYLLTPFPNPQTPAENLYNEAQIRTRNVIERTFGIWKRRFPSLSIGLRCNLPLAQNVIVVTAILHNLACTNRDNLPDGDEQDEIDVEDAANNGIILPAVGDDAVRRTMVIYFQRLLNNNV